MTCASKTSDKMSLRPYFAESIVKCCLYSRLVCRPRFRPRYILKRKMMQKRRCLSLQLDGKCLVFLHVRPVLQWNNRVTLLIFILTTDGILTTLAWIFQTSFPFTAGRNNSRLGPLKATILRFHSLDAVLLWVRRLLSLCWTVWELVFRNLRAMQHFIRNLPHTIHKKDDLFITRAQYNDFGRIFGLSVYLHQTTATRWL